MAELTMSEAAAKTHALTGQEIAEVSLRAAAQRGALKAHKKGKDWYTTDAELKRYLKSRPEHFKQKARTDRVTGQQRQVHMVTKAKQKSSKKNVKVR